MSNIGHNSGDAGIVTRDMLDEQTAALLTVVRDACKEPAPDTITEHADATKVTARLGTLANLGKKIDEAHKAAKAPHLAAGKACDAWKADARRNLDALSAALNAVLTEYQRAVADQERKRREDLAASARQFADMSGDRRADHLATSMEAHAAKPDAGMSRVTSRTGASASLRTTWTFEVEDATKLPREYLMPCEAAIRAAVQRGVRDIPGVKIFERQLTVVRS
jgi:hypothetical protein